LLMERDEISNIYRGSSIDASYQVSVHLAEGFQRKRLKHEKLTDDRRRMPSDGKRSPALWAKKLAWYKPTANQNLWSQHQIHNLCGHEWTLHVQLC
jgi:hypothetical protein